MTFTPEISNWLILLHPPSDPLKFGSKNTPYINMYMLLQHWNK